MKTIQYNDNSELWQLERKLKLDGYVKTSECYWYQNYKRGDEVIVLERN